MECKTLFHQPIISNMIELDPMHPVVAHAMRFVITTWESHIIQSFNYKMCKFGQLYLGSMFSVDCSFLDSAKTPHRFKAMIPYEFDIASIVDGNYLMRALDFQQRTTQVLLFHIWQKIQWVTLLVRLLQEVTYMNELRIIMLVCIYLLSDQRWHTERRQLGGPSVHKLTLGRCNTCVYWKKYILYVTSSELQVNMVILPAITISSDELWAMQINKYTHHRLALIQHVNRNVYLPGNDIGWSRGEICFSWV